MGGGIKKGREIMALYVLLFFLKDGGHSFMI